MLENYLDEMFNALYDGVMNRQYQLYSEVYYYECKDIIEEFEIWIGTVKNYCCSKINTDTIGAMLIYLEQKYIGNDLYISYEELDKLSLKILNKVRKVKNE